jgi:hypothetical protein
MRPADDTGGQTRSACSRALRRTRSCSPPPAKARGQVRQPERGGVTSEVPGAEWELPTQIYEDDILLLEWKATSAGSKVEDGIDTFVFRDGLIRVQTVRYTLQRI